MNETIKKMRIVQQPQASQEKHGQKKWNAVRRDEKKTREKNVEFLLFEEKLNR